MGQCVVFVCHEGEARRGQQFPTGQQAAMDVPNQAFVEAVDPDELEASRRGDQEKMDADLAVQNEQLDQIKHEVGCVAEQCVHACVACVSGSCPALVTCRLWLLSWSAGKPLAHRLPKRSRQGKSCQ